LLPPNQEPVSQLIDGPKIRGQVIASPVRVVHVRFRTDMQPRLPVAACGS
jgi:hypothetical protein